jgi:predicted  nucleic acid-binding Zn-ribbon protein
MAQICYVLPMSDRSDALMPEVVQLLKVMIQRQDETNAALKGLAGRVDGIAGQLTETNERLEALRIDTHERLEALRGEVHELRGDVRSMSDHGDRIRALEQVVFKRAG